MTTSIFDDLNRLAPAIPFPLYWLDKEGVFLGGNEQCLKVTGATSLDKFIGKSYDQIHPKGVAEELVKNINRVIETGKTVETEEVIKDFSTGNTRYFTAIRSPLRDENNHIVGIIATSIEITDKKEAERLRRENEAQQTKLQEQEKFKTIINQISQEIQSPFAVVSILAKYCSGMTAKKIFETLQSLASAISVPVYWIDTKGVFLGGNEQCLRVTGATSLDRFIGKTYDEIHEKSIAEGIIKYINMVFSTKKTVESEEIIKDLATGKERYFNSFRSPLIDETGKIVGIIATSIEITDKKEAERLKLENERQKNELEQAEKLRQIAKSVVHDIGSPIQSLRIMVEGEKNISEFNRIVIRNSTNRINDIMNNLTAKYISTGEIVDDSPNVVAPEIISCLVDGILSEKRVQYADYDITFELHIANDAQGLFAKVNSERFKRIMSNVVNNAVEAIAKMQQKHGCINIQVYKTGNLLDIQIKDNGCGIPRSILEKIGVDQITTKTTGDHGIGLSSAIVQLKEWGGSYNIDSQEGVGVTFTIGLPIAPVPDWFLDKISFAPQTQIVILDDDESIHNVWEMRFKEYLDKITLHHFTSPTMLLKCLANLQTYENVLYLIDYELIGSKDTGIDVIAKLQTTKNAFLVTSRYEDSEVREACAKLKVKILPKNFAPYIPILVENKIKAKEIDFVIIDDQECITMMWQAMADSHGVKLAAFNKTKDFENIKDKLDKTTPIYIDRNLEPEDGLEYSKKLAAEGFTDIYLATADSKRVITEPTPWLKGVVDKRPPFI